MIEGAGDGRTRPPSQATLQRAAEWFSLMRTGEVSDADRQAWTDWLTARPEHHTAWQQVEAISRRFEPLQETALQGAATTALHQVRTGRPSRRQVINGMAAVGGLGAAGWLAGRDGSADALQALWADHRSATGEVREWALSDGTQLWLNTASAMNADLDGVERRLRLLEGEALIHSVGLRDERPLLVHGPHGGVRGQDSRFAMRLEGPTTLLTVFHGAVALRTAAAGQRRDVRAGEQTRFSADRLFANTPADAARQSWTRGVLLAQDIPLRDLIDELARYTRRHFSVSAEVGSLKVVGGYPLKDPDHVLTMLQSVLPIRIRRPMPWWVSIEPR